MTNNKQQTAVQMAIAHYKKLSEEGSNQAYVVAKFLEETFLEMEKERMIDAHINGQSEFDVEARRIKNDELAEMWYNETYGGGDK
jgi:hypothetical protein